MKTLIATIFIIFCCWPR